MDCSVGVQTVGKCMPAGPNDGGTSVDWMRVEYLTHDDPIFALLHKVDEVGVEATAEIVCVYPRIRDRAHDINSPDHRSRVPGILEVVDRFVKEADRATNEFVWPISEYGSALMEEGLEDRAVSLGAASVVLVEYIHDLVVLIDVGWVIHLAVTICNWSATLAAVFDGKEVRMSHARQNGCKVSG